MRKISISHIIAMTICECDGREWMDIFPPERDRYARIGILAEDRIRTAMADQQSIVPEDMLGGGMHGLEKDSDQSRLN